MDILIGLGVVVAAVGVLAYWRPPLWLATVLLAAVLLLVTRRLGLGTVSQIGLWLGFAIPALLLNIVPLRRAVLSAPILNLFRKIMPSMSQTESEAIEAGTVWWDGELFSGKPRWQTLLAYPEPRLSEEEQAFVDGPVQELCAMLDDWRISHELQDLPPEVWQFIKDKGFFGMIIPKRYGGLEFSALTHSSVVMKIASRSVTAAVTIMVPNSLGPAELLLHYGTDKQKDYYLPRLAKGEEIPCFALTGPEAGSDAGAMPDTGVICRQDHEDQSDVLGMRLNWDKRYITLGPVATVLGLAFKLYDPDHHLGEQEELGITVALIPIDTPGITIGRRHNPLNIPFQNGPNSGKDVFIPLDLVIGGAERVGQGWRMLMESLAAGRSISLPALSTGSGKLASRSTGAYARVRRQFKVPIGRFEGVEEALARIGAYTYMMDAARVMTAGAVDLGEKPSVVSAIVKYHLTEHMRAVVNDAMDIRGGSGICLGPHNLIGRAYQALPISITVEGANILTRSLIIYGQGAIRCHPYVLQEMHAVADADHSRALRNFDSAFFGHIGFTIRNAARSLFLGLSGGYLTLSLPGGKGRRYFRRLNHISAAFALASDVAMLVLGGSLKRRERLSARLADVLSHMYLASATLKRFHDQGMPAEDVPMLRWVCDYCLYESEQALDGLLRNFPNRPIAWLLRVILFPLGRHAQAPTDRLGHQIASLLLEPSEARDRLTRGVYISDNPDDAVGRLEVGLDKVLAAESAMGKLAKAGFPYQVTALGDFEGLLQHGLQSAVLTADEADLLRQAEPARQAVIRVDDFPPDMH